MAVKVKILILIQICVLTIYAPLELSRAIIVSPRYSLLSEFTAELFFLWTFYIVGMAIVWKYIRR